jgi:hypothetical protein
VQAQAQSLSTRVAQADISLVCDDSSDKKTPITLYVFIYMASKHVTFQYANGSTLAEYQDGKDHDGAIQFVRIGTDAIVIGETYKGEDDVRYSINRFTGVMRMGAMQDPCSVLPSKPKF